MLEPLKQLKRKQRDAAREAAAATRSVQLPMQQRDLQLRSETFSTEARTVDVVWSTGARRAMMNWDSWEMVDEELSLDGASVRLGRMNSGAPVLDTHSRYELDNVIGVVVDGSARIEGGQGLATVQLSAREELAPLVADIAAGIIRNISVGYIVHKYEITAVEGQRQLWRAVDWEPFEISFVPVPADAGAQARGHDAEQGGNPCILSRATPPVSKKDMTMDPEEIAAAEAAAAAARQRAIDDGVAAALAARTVTPPPPAPAVTPVTASRILAATRAASLTQEASDEIVALHDATPLDERNLMAEIGTRFAARDLGGAPQRSTVSVTRDEGDTMRAGMIEATLHRMTRRAPMTELGAGYRGLDMIGIVRELLAARGESTRNLAPAELAQRAMMTTSDLPYVLQNVMNKRLRMAYDENVPSYQVWAKRAPNARDFKTISVSQLSAMPDLALVGEGGEVKYGSITDGVVTYALASYAKMLAFTRQMVINDDLGALDRWAAGFSASARRLENRTVYGQLTGAATYKGGALFSTGAQLNLAASGAVISGTTLNQARSAMRLQKGLQSEELNIAPRYLIVPTALEQLAYQYTSSNFVPAKASDVNEFRAGGRTAIEPIVEAILDATSSTAYYFAADSAQCDTIEYCFLDGAEGVQLESMVDFDSGGLKLRASEDFASAAIDYRGFYKNPGA